MPNHQHQRRFALDVVTRLRAAGFEAYWAGGCVRDEILGRPPKDYDVATNATPAEVRRLFGMGRTLAIGAAFGVIAVLGPRGAGQVEVTTFRRDARYSDGRHPDAVVFSSAKEDASRRDFTINGLFFDPVENRVIDYVGGQDDLRRGLIRAIRQAEERFAEDKMRMLRAVRFAATFQYPLEPATLAAIRRMATEIRVVSPERIATEMRRMLVDVHRGQAVRLLVDTGLTAVVLPEIEPGESLQRRLAVIERLAEPEFPLALAGLLVEAGAAAVEAVGRRWRLSNRETERAVWLVAHRDALRGAPQRPWSRVHRVLAHEGAPDLVALREATLRADGEPLDEVDWCRQMLARPRAELAPPPLLPGDDLRLHGVRMGPIYRELLDALRDAQLDGRISSRAEALALVDDLLRNA